MGWFSKTSEGQVARKYSVQEEITKMQEELEKQNAELDYARQRAIAAANAQGAIMNVQQQGGIFGSAKAETYFSNMKKLEMRLGWKQLGNHLVHNSMRVITVEETKDSYAIFYLKDGEAGMYVEPNPELFPSDQLVTAMRLLA